MSINFICPPENVPQLRTVLSPDDKLSVFCRMLAKATQYKLPRGIFAIVETELSVDRRSRRGRLAQRPPVAPRRPLPVFSIQKVFLRPQGRGGQRRRPCRHQSVPLEDRMCMLSIATKAGLTVWQVRRFLSQKKLRVAKNQVKPTLTSANRVKRLRFARSFVIRSPVEPPRFLFDPTYDVVHLDDIWFNLVEMNQKLYLLDDEEDPVRKTWQKSHILKIMFLFAVARLRGNFNGKVRPTPTIYFSG